jgi:hypothetical protein
MKNGMALIGLKQGSTDDIINKNFFLRSDDKLSYPIIEHQSESGAFNDRIIKYSRKWIIILGERIYNKPDKK